MHSTKRQRSRNNAQDVITIKDYNSEIKFKILSTMKSWILKAFLLLSLAGSSYGLTINTIDFPCIGYMNDAEINISAGDIPAAGTWDTYEWDVSTGIDASLSSETTNSAHLTVNNVDELTNGTVTLTFKNGSTTVASATRNFTIRLNPGNVSANVNSSTHQSTEGSIDLGEYFTFPSSSEVSYSTSYSVPPSTNYVSSELVTGNNFNPSKVLDGFGDEIPVTCTITANAGGCSRTATTNIIVVNGSATLPNFLNPVDGMPICKNTTSFRLQALSDCPGSMNIRIDYANDGFNTNDILINGLTYSSRNPFTGAYLYNFNINPGLVGTTQLIGIRITVSSSGSGCPAKIIDGKIPVTPLPEIKILGFYPDSGLVNTNDALICSANLNQITMRGFPERGYFSIYKNGTQLLTEGLDIKSSPSPSQVRRDKYTFTPNEIFEEPTLGDSNLSTFFRMVYRYPESNAGVCQDSIIVNLRFVQPNTTNFIINTASPYCYGTPLDLKVTGSGTGDRFIWEFRDSLNQTFKITDTLSDTTYTQKFDYPGIFKIRLQSFASSISTQCDNDVMIDMKYGAKPVAHFDVKGLQEGVPTTFTGSTGVEFQNLANADNVIRWFWKWDADDPLAVWESASQKDTVHTFTDVRRSTYKVMLITQAGWECTDTTYRYVPVFPLRNPNDSNPFLEDFDDVNEVTGFYHSGQFEQLKDSSSWQNISPDSRGLSTIKGADPAWITSKNFKNPLYNFRDTSGYYRGERSWIETPYFDLQNISRPVLIMDNWCHTDNAFDGATIQYCLNDSVFGKEKWTTIGDDVSGLNWYNSNTVISLPGQRYYPADPQLEEFYGWTGTENTKGWKLTSYPLDSVKAKSVGKYVRFRIAFASNNDNKPYLYFDGFAFNNFRLENRNRFVVLEEFVRTGVLDNINSSVLADTQAINIKHFVGHEFNIAYPDGDPVYNLNRADPGVRSLFYGISTLPRTIIDGTVRNNSPFGTSNWGEDKYALRRLLVSPFEFTTPVTSVVNGKLKIDVSINKVKNIPIAGPFTVHTVVVSNEGTIPDVLRKLLPSASGTRITDTSWTVYNLPSRFWTPTDEMASSTLSNVKVIVFIQDENTKEIYQAVSKPIDPSDVALLDPEADPAITQGFPGARIADMIPEAAVYPNPSASELFVEFETPLLNGLHYSIQNNIGVEVANGTIANGVDMQRLFVSNLQSGFYSITFKNDSDTKTLSFVKQ